MKRLIKTAMLLGCICLLFGWVIRWVWVPGFPPGTPGTWVPVIAPPQQSTNTTQAAVGTAVRIGWTAMTLPAQALHIN